jgi:glycosyltransferase involved in cell wall biosynthesis
LVVRLAERHEVALLAPKGAEEPGIDPELAEACTVVEEVPIPQVGKGIVVRARHRAKIRAALLRGLPTWAAERRAPQFESQLGALVQAWRPDLVQFEYRIMAQFLPAVAAVAPCVLVEHDPVSGSSSRSWLALLERRAWRRLAHVAACYARAIVVLTERDRAAIEAECRPARVERIPLGYGLPCTPLDPAGTNPGEIVYVGSFVHPPNVEGARWLALDVFPFVKRRVPYASLRLVGSQPTREVLALQGDSIAVTGDVEAVSPYLDAAAVVAAPIRSGGGMRVKVLEALSAGKAVVATPLAVDGLGVQDGEQVMIAETESQFSGALIELLRDRERRVSLAGAARRWAEANLDLDQRVRAYEALYEEILR